MARFLIVMFLALFPVLAEAACKGRDLRDTLGAEQADHFARQAARIPYSEGMHWVARKGDQTIHVIGTLHDGDRRLNKFMRAVSPYLRKADLIVLETQVRTAQADLEKLTGNEKVFLLQRPPYLDQIMQPALWKQVQGRTSLQGVGNEGLRRLQPLFLTQTLSSPECDPFNWQRKKRGFEEKIDRFARRRGIPVMGLETAGQSLQAYLAIPLRDQVRLLELQLQSTSGRGDRATTLRNTYFEEKLALGLMLDTHFSYRDVRVSRKEVARIDRVMSSYLLDRRNRKWIPLLMARKEQTIAVAVGGAHLPGRNGVLNLLRARGYKLQRIPMTKTN